MKSVFTHTFLYTSILLIGVLASCKEKRIKLSERTDEALSQELNDEEVVSKLLTYAKENGVEIKDKSNAFNVLTEISFGHKPSFIKYVAEASPIDSAAVRTAGWSIVQGVSVDDALKNIEPKFPSYEILKKEYVRLVNASSADSARKIAETLNAYRWINRQSRHSVRTVLVNIRGAYLMGFDSTGKQALNMRVVAGKKDKATPPMDTYATQVITHPYWNVPRSIVIEEMLPKIQRNRGYLEDNNIEVIDQKGKLVDPESVKWSTLSVNKFPYRLRQNTGSDNSLGLLKVELKNPLAIYLHDTNARYLFEKEERWRSHGCVRVQRPTDLANFMAGKDILESDSLDASGSESLPPTYYKLPARIPVFLLYLPVDVNENGQIQYYKDVYGWEG